jgi:hypothetical protein
LARTIVKPQKFMLEFYGDFSRTLRKEFAWAC